MVQEMVLDHDTSYLIDENREVVKSVIPLFPFFRSNRHFHWNKKELVTKLKDLSVLEAIDQHSLLRFTKSLKVEVVDNNSNVFV